MEKELKTIYDVQKKISVLSSVLGLLDWDQKTYMPRGSNDGRAEQVSAIGKLIHEQLLSEKLFKAVSKLHDPRTFKTLKKRDQIVVKVLYEDVLDARKLPIEFVEELSRVSSKAVMAWQEAKEKDDFRIFAPWLEKVVELKKKHCRYVKIPGHPYNSLLNDFEKGMTVEKIRPVFQNLRDDLVSLLNDIKKTRSYKIQKSILKNQSFPIAQQRRICQDVVNWMHLPESKSRLDVSSHPFTLGISLKDVRITTRYNEETPFPSFYSVVHESGHALYQLGLPSNFEYTVIANSASMGLHESQSRFWENMIARNTWFWKFYFSFFKKTFKEEFKSAVLEDFYKEVNMVRPGMIRVDADEVTYCLHVILRFELEVALIEGSLKVKDLPKAWNEKMSKFLGITPKDDREGVLQDTHWGMGAFGYFPTYAIGTIYAAQLFHQLVQDKPHVKEQIEKGNFTHVIEWLRKNVHEHGRTLTAEEIIKKSCGKGLSPDAYIQYLRNKYLAIYK